MHSSAGSVTVVIDDLKKGDRAALAKLWKRYFESLVRKTRWRLKAIPRLAADDEDVALSAFDSFFRALENDRFPDLHDRNDLWQILVMLAGRKAGKRIRKAKTQIEGGGKVVTLDDFKDVLSRDPTPEEAAEFADVCERLIAQLKDPILQLVAQLKLEGCSNEDIARKLNLVTRSVERKLSAIRSIWAKENPG
jgi:DNA-directed RNA polymerase specialized sigma24 family protein